jgi:HEAT repeat protein
MKTPPRKFWLVVAVIAAAVLVWWNVGKREPSARGKSLSHWIESGEPSASERSEALSEMGAAAVPHLVRRLEWKPSGFMRRLHNWVPFLSDIIGYQQGRYDPRSGAAWALGEIGPTAVPALPKLGEMTTISDLPSSWGVNVAAKAAIVKIKGESLDPYIERLRNTTDVMAWYPDAMFFAEFGTNAVGAVPLLVAALALTNNGVVHSHAAIALGRIRSRPEVCVPALASALRTPDVGARQNIALTLMEFGEDAKPAWNELVKAAAAADPYVRAYARRALKNIDPEAAKKLNLD